MNRPATEIPGLVWGYMFSNDGVQPTEFGPLDSSVVPTMGGFRWLHLALSDARVPAFLASFPGLPEAALQSLTSRDNHTAAQVDEGVFHGVLVDFQRTFDEETRDIGWMRFAIGPDYVLTTRLHPLRSVDRARAIIAQATKVRQPVDVIDIVVMEFIRALVTLVSELTDELNVIEDYVYDDAPRNERRRLGPVRRTLAGLHRHLRGLLSTMRRIEISDEDEIPPDCHALAERLADRIERVHRDVFSLQERARLLHEEIDSKISAETNRHLYILSVMTAFMLPPTLVAGIFGMNTNDLPFINDAGGTWYALGLCALSTGLAWYFLRRIGIF